LLVEPQPFTVELQTMGHLEGAALEGLALLGMVVAQRGPTVASEYLLLLQVLRSQGLAVVVGLAHRLVVQAKTVVVTVGQT
jgi:hypothetical protein